MARNKCQREQCERPADVPGGHCEACQAQKRRQEPAVESAMDGKGPRGW